MTIIRERQVHKHFMSAYRKGTPSAGQKNCSQTGVNGFFQCHLPNIRKLANTWALFKMETYILLKKARINHLKETESWYSFYFSRKFKLKVEKSFANRKLTELCSRKQRNYC